jgi:hypothetical protein
MNRFASFAAGLAFFAGSALAGEKALMHCFAFTVVDSATPAQWETFKAETDALPGKIKGLKRVWHGKLVRPLQYNAAQITDDATRKQLTADGKLADAKANVTVVKRQHGVCMEFDNLAAFQAYGKDPAHASWVKAYEPVRVSGTTTYQIQGE